MRRNNIGFGGIGQKLLGRGEGEGECTRNGRYYLDGPRTADITLAKAREGTDADGRRTDGRTGRRKVRSVGAAFSKKVTST